MNKAASLSRSILHRTAAKSLFARTAATPAAAASPTTISTRQVHIEKKIEELGITLPSPSAPKANYNIVCHASGNMLYVSGHLPIKADGELCTGRVGPESGGKTVEEGYEAARHCGLNIISTLKDQLGDLDRVEQIVKVRSFSFY